MERVDGKQNSSGEPRLSATASAPAAESSCGAVRSFGPIAASRSPQPPNSSAATASAVVDTAASSAVPASAREGKESGVLDFA